ncbi:hypothetical protein [Hymenobacter jejuensis]|uniref:Uncharacterized protein n=1 Tax=Hymenobacter jejuensis TaxID=2502781 RepID=A0A5B7ZXI9_9BACT|nr:hypothetical protein [Hymenobacter jejuensis]QDA59891.1 hypothetical protein FHG12_07120 [Hymenobacter jejuensis]
MKYIATLLLLAFVGSMPLQAAHASAAAGPATVNATPEGAHFFPWFKSNKRKHKPAYMRTHKRKLHYK